VATVATGAIASRWFPVGLSAKVDADRGVQVDPLLLAFATVGVVAFIAVQVLVAASRSTRTRDAGAPRPSWARIGVIRPLAIGLGVRIALEGGRRTRRGTARMALLGAVAAVAGIVAILTLNDGLDDSLRHPELAGVSWDATVLANEDDASPQGISAELVNRIASQPGVAAADSIGRVVTQIGEVGVPMFTVFPGSGVEQVELVTLEGRGPRDETEITLGPSTARDLGVEIGDTVSLPDGAVMSVVGFGLFPTDVHAQFDEGAAVVPDRFESLVAALGGEGAGYAVAVRFDSGATADERLAELRAGLGDTVAAVDPAERPDELTNLDNVRRLPRMLATFLAILGVVAVGHALFTTVRRQRKDFAVLRALGITPRGIRGIFAAQASTVAVIGLALGIPVGLLAGRVGWRAITDRVPLIYRSPITATVMVLVIPAVIVVANALAVIPGRRAARLEPGLALRAE